MCHFSFFFFSSRRRHTRYWRDWSSDVCSSDLDRGNHVFTNPLIFDKLTNEGNTYFSLTERYERGVTLSASATYGYAGKYVFNGVLRSEEHTSELQSRQYLVCRLLLEKKTKITLYYLCYK